MPSTMLSESAQETIARVKDAIRSIPDFPKPGILFRDFTPILKDHTLFSASLAWFEYTLQKSNVDYIVGIESRGFIIGSALAQRLQIGFVPARKMGKLPGLVERHQYDLEYGSDCIEMHHDAFPKGSRIAIVDDLLATGGTSNATVTLCRKLGADVVGALFLIELSALEGRKALPTDVPVSSMVTFD